ncbi:carbohydrate ABC transporter permease [Paenibacillus hamazuiensis]|uniref:carbohydrate ABC transporter permease n=1 Tax=Paenibacillus hamazuiensis TaxID=2936508 RepID=UPI00200E59DA|nr:carbohydrate ABC transporter permease [Paenibacillus hamazuiensis]
MKTSFGERVFSSANYIILALLSLTMLFPIVHVAAISLSSKVAAEGRQVFLWPVDFNISAWKHILTRTDLWQSFGVNVFVTIVGTVVGLFLTCLLAYPLTKKAFVIRKIVLLAVILTMIFKPPMIPYFLVLKSYGFYNSMLALIIPSLIHVFNLMLVVTFFRQLPHELEEAAHMDGAHAYQILLQVVMPLSKPVLATVGLFMAVSYWNLFYHAVLFITDKKLYPLQLKLREFITESEGLVDIRVAGTLEYNTQTIESAAIIVATIPIILVYPFIQKYFVKGATLGSVKE